MQINRELAKLGFSPREAQVYLAILELGSAGAQDIARKSGEKRTTIYEVCKTLIKRGAVVESLKNSKKVFSAEDPSILAINLLSQQSTLETIMPALKGMMRSESSKPIIRSYDTIKGIKQAYENLLHSQPDEILTTVSPKNLSSTLGKQWLTDFIKRRIQLTIPVRALSIDDPSSDSSEYWKARDKEDLRKTKFLTTKLPIPAIDVLIYKNKVTFVTFDTELMALSIESQIISDYMRMLFNLFWKMTPQNH